MEQKVIYLAGQTSGIDNLLLAFSKQGDNAFHQMAEHLASAIEKTINKNQIKN